MAHCAVWRIALFAAALFCLAQRSVRRGFDWCVVLFDALACLKRPFPVWRIALLLLARPCLAHCYGRRGPAWHGSVWRIALYHAAHFTRLGFTRLGFTRLIIVMRLVFCFMAALAGVCMEVGGHVAQRLDHQRCRSFSAEGGQVAIPGPERTSNS